MTAITSGTSKAYTTRSFLNGKFFEKHPFYVFLTVFRIFGEMTAITPGTLKIR